MKKDKTRILFTLWAALFLTINGSGEEVKLNLMPIPAKVVQKEGKFRLTETFTAAVKGPAPGRLLKAGARLLHRLSGRTGLFFSQGNFPTGENWESAGLGLTFKRVGRLKVGEDESYTLTAAPERVEIVGETDIGVIRGLETLLQLIGADDRGYFIPAVEINDRPRFPWRGLLIDVCRHFQPVEVIKRNLDGMCAVKMNVLHWHLSEDQGFRVECKSFPKLHQLGSDGLYYTQEQIREVIAYAADRGIRVMPEFDIPGHSTSWLVGYPELAGAAGPYEIERRWGIFDPTFDPTRKATYKFFKKFFAEMTALFPDEYMHIGGDENNGKQWDANPKIQAFMKKHNIPDNHALQAYFNKRILAILTRNGKKMIGWDEIFQPGLPKNIIIHSWRGQEALKGAAKKGYPVILSNGYYIDLVQSAEYHYLNDPIPPDSPLTEEEKKFILGGEATMWGELISPETIDSRIWPRTAAIAERLWSPGQVKDVPDMYRRLEIISLQLEELGLLHKKNQAMMLRRLTGGRDIHPLKILIDVTEPLKGYKRHQGRVYTQFSPLTCFVDAALPDAKVAGEFRRQVDLYMQNRDEKSKKKLRRLLTLWEGNHKRLKVIIDQSPILKEIESLSEDLSRVAQLGLEALDLLSSGKKAEPTWIEEKKEILKKAALPRGQVELMILSAIEKLAAPLRGET
ncbi:MAG: family 20 glycosylhydrolase [Candidatus Aminicenantes bacterium]|nr:family 20 glycosylhydrolase [Candidatus Aminicenantes bacterium]